MTLLAKLLNRVWMMNPERFGALHVLAMRAEKGEEVSFEAITSAIGCAKPAPIDTAMAAGMGIANLSVGGGNAKPFVQVGSTAIIDIWGVLDQTDADVTGWRGERFGTSYDMIRRQTAAAMADESVKGILARINSPGGDAMSVEQVAMTMFGAKTGAKKIVALADPMAASAALYLGSQASQMFATPGSWIGCIGTICHYADYSKMLADYGIAINTIKSNEGKDAGSPYRPMSDADRKTLQAEIDAYGRQFDAALARGRNLSADAVVALRTKARGYVGADAVGAGLADGTVNDVYALLAQMEGGYAGSKGSRDRGIKGSGGEGIKGSRDQVIEATGNKGESAVFPQIRRDPNVSDGAGGGTAVEDKAKTGGGIDPAQRQAILDQDNKRRKAIQSRAFAFSNNADIVRLAATCAEDSSCTPEQFSDRAVQMLAEKNPPTGHVATPHGHGGQGSFASAEISVGTEQREKVQGGLVTSLLMRTTPGIASRIDGNHPKRLQIARAIGYDTPDLASRAIAEAGGSGFRGMSLMDVAAHCLAAGGRMSLSDAVNLRNRSMTGFMSAAFHTSSDFPKLMANLANKTLLAAYAEVETFWQDICRIGTANDYKDAPMISVSEMGDFEDLPEGRTPGHKTFNERQESIAVSASGLRFGLTFQAMVNDDLGAFSQKTQMIGAAAARVPDAKALTLLGLNSGLGPTMSDGSTLCHANHLNITTQAALSYAAAWADRVAFRKQKGFGPNTSFIDVTPTVLLVPVDLEPVAADLAMQEYVPGALASPTSATQRNTLRGRFKVRATPKLTGTRRYWFADPNTAPAIEMRFFRGQQTPEIVELPQNDPMTMELQATLLGVGCAALQWEGVQTNAG